jgi:hypothetical protein
VNDLNDIPFDVHPADRVRRSPWRTLALVILAATAPVAFVGLWFLWSGGL